MFLKDEKAVEDWTLEESLANEEYVRACKGNFFYM